MVLSGLGLGGGHKPCDPPPGSTSVVRLLRCAVAPFEQPANAVVLRPTAIAPGQDVYFLKPTIQ